MWTVYLGFLCISLSLAVLILAGALWLLRRATDDDEGPPPAPPPLASGQCNEDFPRTYRGA